MFGDADDISSEDEAKEKAGGDEESSKKQENDEEEEEEEQERHSDDEAEQRPVIDEVTLYKCENKKKICFCIRKRRKRMNQFPKQESMLKYRKLVAIWAETSISSNCPTFFL